MAEAPTPELPPRTRMDNGGFFVIVDSSVGIPNRGIFRPWYIAAAAVQ